LRFQLQLMHEASLESQEEGEGSDVWVHTHEVHDIASQKERLDRALAGARGQVRAGPTIRGW
jgi:hypothetical protein